jgi:hypothetical protein
MFVELIFCSHFRKLNEFTLRKVSKTGRFILKTRMIEATELHLNKTGNKLERHNEAHLCNRYCYVRATNISYFECLCVALDIPACNASYCRLWPVWLYDIFSHYFIKKIGHKFFTIFSEIFLILRRNEPDMIIHVYWSSYKVQIILFRF